MIRYALGIEYDGSDFQGWQRQRTLPTVQASLEQALSKVADCPVQAVCAGRTDAKVHAKGQVVHFDVPASLVRTERAWVMGTNSFLHKSVRALWIKQVPNEFDARKTALSRRYRYIIYNHPIRPSLYRHYVTWVYRTLNAEKMHEAAQFLLGTHDFTSFRASECEAKTPIRTLQEIWVKREGENIILEVEANAFLHHMVRNIMGVLIKIGSGMKEVGWMGEVLAARDRRAAGMTAPPNGLYLIRVQYPEFFGLPKCF